MRRCVFCAVAEKKNVQSRCGANKKKKAHTNKIYCTRFFSSLNFKFFVTALLGLVLRSQMCWLCEKRKKSSREPLKDLGSKFVRLYNENSSNLPWYPSLCCVSWSMINFYNVNSLKWGLNWTFFMTGPYAGPPKNLLKTIVHKLLKIFFLCKILK